MTSATDVEQCLFTLTLGLSYQPLSLSTKVSSFYNILPTPDVTVDHETLRHSIVPYGRPSSAVCASPVVASGSVRKRR